MVSLRPKYFIFIGYFKNGGGGGGGGEPPEPPLDPPLIDDTPLFPGTHWICEIVYMVTKGTAEYDKRKKVDYMIDVQ